MKKIAVFIGSRANYSSIKSVLIEINRHPNLELKIILGASAVLDKYGSLDKIIKKDGFKIYKKIFFLIEGETPLTMAKSTGIGLVEMSSVLDSLKPDVFLTIGDRFETVAGVLAAAYMNIPVAHTMGGEVSGTIDESIRHAITKFAHIHFPASSDAALRIKKLGENKKNIFLVGCPRIDLVKNVLRNTSFNNIIHELKKNGVGSIIDFNKDFLLLSQHPVTTEYSNSEQVIKKTLNAINRINIQTIVLWPNPDAGSALLSKGIRKFRENNINIKMRFYKNFSPEAYIHLMNKTKCLIGNSSSGIREGAFIGTPVVNIGTRQQGRRVATNILSCNNNENNIYNAIKFQILKNKYKKSYIYGKGEAGKKIANILSNIKVNIQKKITY